MELFAKISAFFSPLAYVRINDSFCQVVAKLEEIRSILTDGQGHRKDLMYRPNEGPGSLGFHYHSGSDDAKYLVQSMIAGGPAHISGQIKRGDAILAVDNVEVGAAFWFAKSRSFQLHGICASTCTHSVFLR